MNQKKFKFVLPSQEYVRVFEPQIRQILEVIADVTGIPGIRRALVTDLSHVGDFLIEQKLTEEKRREFLNKIADALDIQIGDDHEEGYLIEVAQKIIRSQSGSNER